MSKFKGKQHILKRTLQKLVHCDMHELCSYHLLSY